MSSVRLLLIKSRRPRPPVQPLVPPGADTRAPVTGRLFSAVVGAVHRGHLPMECLSAVSDAWFMRKPLPDYVAAVLEGGPA
ncbi:hypothetical protein J2803_004871 [Paraburkholderia phenoliruptrix]|nr:hypothetical protein [Paraburkholderia phenoliruptrix]